MNYKPKSLRKRYPAEYRAWKQSRQRCNNSNNPDYRHYGGRGIRCLFSSFNEFFAILGPRPTAQHSLDRFPDNNGNYVKGNVRWATIREQRNNRRKYSRTKTNSSGVTGVCFDRNRNRWRAYGYRNHKNKSLGNFQFFIDAIRARKVWENAK